MNQASKVILFALFCLFVSISQPAGAECAKTDAQLKGSYVFLNFLDQVSDSKWEVPSEDEDVRMNDPVQLAAAMGLVLGQQARYLGDSAERRNMFDCIYAYAQARAAKLAILWGGDLSRADQMFQQTALGVHDDAELLSLGIDPNYTASSIFGFDWAGRWELASTHPTLWLNRGEPLVVRQKIEIVSDEPEATSVIYGNGSASTQAVVNDNTIEFQMGSTDGKQISISLTITDDGCDGLLVSQGKNNQAVHWPTTCRRL